MYLALSWRNIWRNKKRTVIVAASVFFAVILAALMRSGQLGSYAYMIHSSARLFTGYVQIQGQEYWEKRSLDESIVLDDAMIDQLNNIQHVTNYTTRLEAFALISHQTTTRVAQVIGVDPTLENRTTGLRDNLIAGTYLSENSNGLLIGSGMAELLKVGLGDSLVLYGQGFHGQIAAAILPITGIIKLPFKQMNNTLIILSLEKAQEVFSTGKRVTSIPVMIDNIRHLEQISADIRSMLAADQTLMTWDEMMPELKQNIEVDNVSGLIMLGILYVVIAFGVFGTVMMMVSERAREFAILVSVGMRKIRLLIVLVIETFLVSFIGVVAGIAASIPLILYLIYNPIVLTGNMAEFYEKLNIEPIMPFSGEPSIFISQALVVLLIALVTLVYPVLFIRRLKPAETIRG